jgi:hypothetical protein
MLLLNVMLIKLFILMYEMCRSIHLSDLMRFMRREEATKAMDLFEGAQEHNRVSKRSLKNWVVINLSLHLAIWGYHEL